MLNCLLRLFLALGVVFFSLAYFPGLLSVKPVILERKTSPPFEGPLKPNNRLTPFQKLFEDEVEGPESISIYKDNICTGLATGQIVCIRGGKIKFITQIGNSSCEGNWEEEICGRPMGLRFDKNGTLYAVDAYYGLYKIDIKTGHKTALYESKTEVDGRKCHLINNLDVSKKGDVYFTDSSIWPLKIMVYAILETNPMGRILHYNPRTNKTTVLYEGINFANGIQLSPNEDFLLVSETAHHRVMRYYLKGTKKGKMEVFADNVPGFPDNIRLNPRGNYWLALCGSRTPDHFPILRILNTYPMIRKVLIRAIDVFQYIYEAMDTVLPLPVFIKQLNYGYKSMHFLASVGSPTYGLIVEMNQNGEIIQSLHDPTGSIRFISEVAEHDGHLYLGSPWNNYLGKLKFDCKATR